MTRMARRSCDNELEPGPVHVAPPIVRDELLAFALGASLLVHDGQYLESDMPLKLGWGHSIVPAVLELGRQAEVHTLALYHHDPDRDNDQLEAIETSASAWWREHVRGGALLVAREGMTLEVGRSSVKQIAP